MSDPSDNPLKRLIGEIHRRSLWQVLGDCGPPQPVRRKPKGGLAQKNTVLNESGRLRCRQFLPSIVPMVIENEIQLPRIVRCERGEEVDASDLVYITDLVDDVGEI